jgi:hypothetical protein
MSGFSADWLSLREPVDRRSRNGEILGAIESCFRDRSSITVTDLACGQGSLVHALHNRLPARQFWRFVDNDEALLARAVRAHSGTVQLEARLTDLDRAIEETLALATDLVASSAFIDLVSEPWLARMVRSVANAAVPAYLALTDDGHVTCQPGHPLDDEVMAEFRRHQTRDKGFGPALGPRAASRAAQLFAASGYGVTSKRSDWRLDGADRAVQETMVCGWFDAVNELAALPRPALENWREQRLGWIAAGISTVVVGHLDLWAVPPEVGGG